MKPKTSNWLPDLCRPHSVFGILVAVELVVLVTVLLRPPAGSFAWAQLSMISLLALWLTLICVTVLCQSRELLHRLPKAASMVMALVMPVAIVGVAIWIVVRLDQELGLEFTVAPANTRAFVLVCMVVALLLTAAVLRYAYVAEQWRQQQAATSQAQVEALQARIRPHFLFNAMNTIAGLVRHDPAAAEHAVEDLAELFRAALGSDSRSSTLGEEVHLVRRYLALEALRLGSRLQVDWQLHPELPMDLALPRLILQPLAENAITHGLARLSEGGTLGISIQWEGTFVVIRMRNPMAPDSRAIHGNQHAQKNIALRLLHRFGQRARMVTEARDGYYVVTIHVPVDTP